MKSILFNTEMVKAILGGTKTVTRRVIKFDTAYPNAVRPVENPVGLMTASSIIRPPYQVGNILYVRETWSKTCCCDCEFEGEECEYNIDRGGLTITCDDGVYVYKATDSVNTNIKWHPSIHMPKEATRIFLRITDVRVERLQDITPEDIIKEGFCEVFPAGIWQADFYNNWDSTIKSKDCALYSWNANPWVWVIEFERISKEEATNESL